MLKKVSVLVSLLAVASFLISCATVQRAPITLDPQTAKQNRNKMFSAAIIKGAEMSYQVENQDKENGLLTLTHKIGTTTYRITVMFKEDSVTVRGQVAEDFVNPFINGDVQKIEDAIRAASR